MALIMTAFAFVLTSAALHAVWNYLAKRAEGSMVFTWLFSLIATVIYLPVALYLFINGALVLTPLIVASLAGTVLLHMLYYWLLVRGYQVGDLSLVYPLGRGTGPLLASIGAILLLNEQPTTGVLLGALLVTVGVFLLTGDPAALRHPANCVAIGYGLLIGVSIGAYTLWDKINVSQLLIPPLIVIWVSNASRVLLLTPHALRHGDEIRDLWQRYKREAIGIGILDTFSYVLFLIALQTTNVSTIAPLRQTSILFGTFLGSRLLAEQGGWRRGFAATVVVVGVVVVAWRG
jgi:drug/metabolite transporter (DMT)-like permease